MGISLGSARIKDINVSRLVFPFGIITPANEDPFVVKVLEYTWHCMMVVSLIDIVELPLKQSRIGFFVDKMYLATCDARP